MNILIKSYLGLTLLLLFSVSLSAFGEGDSGHPCKLLKSGLHVENWHYHPGDNPAWAEPGFDHSGWRVGGSVRLDELSSRWTGIGWFRTELEVDPCFADSLLGLILFQSGASEIYLNGKLIKRFGQPSADPEQEKIYVQRLPVPVAFEFKDTGKHVLAIRYSNHNPHYATFMYLGYGFSAWIYDYDLAFSHFMGEFEMASRHQMFFTGLALAFCLLAVLIYFYPPRQKQYLLFAMLCLGLAGISFAPIQMGVAHSRGMSLFLMYLMKISLVTVSIFNLWFLLEQLYNRVPRGFKYFALVGVLLLLPAYFLPRYIYYFYAMATLTIAIVILIKAVLQKRPAVWIIGIGHLMFILFSLYQILLDLTLLPNIIPNYFLYYLYGIIAILISEAVYLASQFSSMHLGLQAQLEEVKKLSARTLEQERRAKEQEMNRKLMQQEIDFQKKELKKTDELERALNQLEHAHRELRAAQSQLVQSEKMASLGMLVAGVAHEINTPVGAINSMNNTLTRAVVKMHEIVDYHCLGECDLSDKLKKYLNAIDNANRVIATGSDRVTDIVRRLRSFARLDEAELKSADVNEGIEDTLTLVHHELKHGIEVSCDFGKIPEIACFPGQLNQVFLNLIINARQAISGEGKLEIATYLEDGLVVIRISDNGCGIKPEIMDKIFDPGFTTKGVGIGTGLGLSICYQIIEAHHGNIEVDSRPGEGTTFTIRLPVDLDKKLENT